MTLFFPKLNLSSCFLLMKRLLFRTPHADRSVGGGVGLGRLLLLVAVSVMPVRQDMERGAVLVHSRRRQRTIPVSDITFTGSYSFQDAIGCTGTVAADAQYPLGAV